MEQLKSFTNSLNLPKWTPVIPALLAICLYNITNISYCIIDMFYFTIFSAIPNIIMIFYIIASTIIFYVLMFLILIFVLGVFTCPTEESFTPWLQNMIRNMKCFISQPEIKPENEPDNLKDKVTNYMTETRYGVTKWLVEQYFINIVPNMINSYYFHLGFCRSVICKYDGDNIIFIGILNTWFPVWKYKID